MRPPSCILTISCLFSSFMPLAQPRAGNGMNYLKPDNLRYYNTNKVGHDKILSVHEKMQFLKAHNYWRAKAAKGMLKDHHMASQMPQIYWDEELAESSKNYSRLCHWGHSEQADLQTLPYEIGENIYITSYKQQNFYKIIEEMASEYHDYHHGNATCKGQVCSHYTQIVWENTVRVGCAKTYCNAMSRTAYDKKHGFYEFG